MAGHQFGEEAVCGDQLVIGSVLDDLSLVEHAALSPVALASFAGEGTSHFGKALLRSYVGVCMEGAVIVLACIIFSAFSSSGTPVVDSSASVVTQVWSYLGEVIFNLLVLVGLVKSADHIAKEMLGL